MATSVLYGNMSAQMGMQVTDYVAGRPDVFLNAMTFVFLTMAAVVGLGFVCTVVRFVQTRRAEHDAERALNG